MKLKRVVLTVLIMILGLCGSLFGCKGKPLKLSIKEGEEEVTKISLSLDEIKKSENSQSQESEENTTNESTENEEIVDLSQKTIYVFAENANQMFKNGLLVSFSEQNVVKCTLNASETNKFADCYAFDIKAIQPKNVVITFETYDKKTNITLLVEVSQDCEKIEKNIHSENFVIMHEDKQLSNNIVKYTPQTTTNTSISFKLASNYAGLNLTETGLLTFADDFDESLTEFYVNVYHKNYDESDDTIKSNYVVENIRFDILRKIDEIVATKDGVKQTTLEFATNKGDGLDYQTIEFKKVVNTISGVSYEDIDNSYELVYYLKSNNNLVSIKPDEQNNFKITISQNGRDGSDVLVAKIQNKTWKSYVSKEIEIAINIKTYPNSIYVNDSKTLSEFVIYDNLQKKELEIKINEGFNTDFKITDYQSNLINLTFENGDIVWPGAVIKSRTKIFLSCDEFINFGTENEKNAYFTIQSVGNQDLTKTINVRIIKSIVDVSIYNDNKEISNQIEICKINLNGESTVTKFDIKTDSKLIIPSFKIEIENTNIVKLESVVNKTNQKSFSLMALTTGQTLVTCKFDNGLVKYFTVKVYAGIKNFDVKFANLVNIGKTDKTTISDNGTEFEVFKYYIKNQTVSSLYFEATDINNRIVYDSYIISNNYEIINNEANIALSNADNKLYALKSTNKSQLLTIKAQILAMVFDENSNKYEQKTLTKIFCVEVYEPIKNLSLSKNYVELFAKDSLGYEDYAKSESEIEILVSPENATEFNFSNISFVCYSDGNSVSLDFIGATKNGTDSENNQIYKLSGNKLKITAEKLDNKTTDTATISFSVQDYVGALFTTKITVKVTKAITPEKIIVENVQKISDSSEEKDYLYFNLNLDDKQQGININPTVYPLNSLNSDYDFEIINDDVNDEEDIITFDKAKGVVSPLKAGKGRLILTPKGSISKDDAGNKVYKNQRVIYITVADGEKIPYSISSKQELLNLCKEQEIDESNKDKFIERFSKSYVLIKDIDLSGESIVPIGIYRLKTKTDSQITKQAFTGSFSGLFVLDGTKQKYSITGIKIDINSIYLSISKDMYLGLFAENNGNISDLTIQYSVINMFMSATQNPENSQSVNKNYSLYFGGVSALNKKTIENCNVQINSCGIETYFGNNFIGAVVGKNQTTENETTKANIKNCFASGNINVVDGYNKNEIKSNLFVGGIAGENAQDSIISGEFNIYDNKNEIFNKNIFNVTLNLSSILNGELSAYSQDSAFGGIVGLNNGTVTNMACYGKIFAHQNIGGVAGINSGTVGGEENAKSLGCFSASIIYANNVAGGLIGKNTGVVNYNSVMLVDDEENFEKNGIISKIYANSDVGGLIGVYEKGSISKNFVRSYVQKADNYFDIYVEKARENLSNFGGLYSKDIDSTKIVNDKIEIISGNNFADNLKIGYVLNEKLKNVLTTGSVNNIGIVAPDEITVSIKESTLTEENNLFGYNKFIKGNEDSIVLYYYNGINSKYNYYLRNQLFEIGQKPEGSYDLKKIESLMPEVLSVDDKGNFVVNKTGETKIKIYSVLNKSAYKEINVKIIEAIDGFAVFEDSLYKTKINTLYLEKDTTKNIYFSEIVLQKDVYAKYSSHSNIVVNESEEYSQVLSCQTIYGKTNGTETVTAQLYVKINNNYVELPLSYSFNVSVVSGLKQFNTTISSAQLSKNAFVNFEAEVLTDLADKTNFAVVQYYEVEDEQNQKVLQKDGEYLGYEFDKNIGGDKISLSFKTFVNGQYFKEIVNRKITFKIYAYDNFASLAEIRNNEAKYGKYIRTIEFIVKENDVINAEMSYFADGEVAKNEEGQEVINTNELESEFIKIGKIGILKIQIYPKEILNSNDKISLTYSNSDNFNLSFKQVKKLSSGYVDVTGSEILSNGIVLGPSYLLADENEQYLYVKLLTDSPIKEGSLFNLKLNIGGYDYSFEKGLTSVLSSNLEISFDGAVLNSVGNLESVYAKGVSEQYISLTVNKLTDFVPTPVINTTNLSGSNYVDISLISEPIKTGKESLRYDYVIKGLNNNSGNESVELYFYIDKVVNFKTERYKSNTLKLNIVDFVVKNVQIENVENNYLTKPVGTSYPLKVKLNTISDGTSEVKNLIASLEDEISKKLYENQVSKSAVWKFNDEFLQVGFDYKDFEILKNEYFEIKPKQAKKINGFSAKFAVQYNSNSISFLKNSDAVSDIFFDNGKYSKQFNLNFGAEFYIQTDINNPIPIYSPKEFIEMKTGGNYILMNDIVLATNKEAPGLENGYTPFVGNFNSLDGNGYSVSIKDLNIDLTQTSLNFGLFTEISENSILKNLTLKFNLNASESSVISSSNKLNFENILTLTYGSICAVNKGLIYNCFVEGMKTGRIDQVLNISLSNLVSDQVTSAVIGGFVGRNEGIITNSRSELMLSVSKGFIGGFVCENIGTISACYYKNIFVKNMGEDENTSNSAGFVYSNQGTIKFSFVEGNSKFSNNGVYTLDPAFSGYAIMAPTSVAGFVFINFGDVQDCYANLSISSQSYSGGFVYSNQGTILRSYSATINEKQNNTAHAPFIATKVEFNEEDMKTRIVDCYYLSNNNSSVNDNLVTKLSLSEFNDEYYLTNFVFDNNNTIWKFTNQNSLPSLVEANNIATSKRQLYSVTETSDGSVKYSYIYCDGYYAGSENNPIIISNEEEFIEYFAFSGKTNNQYYRIVNNINFGDYASVPTYNYVFSGKLDGNGLQISNIRISAPSNYVGDSFGLFSKIESYSSDSVAVVKNIELQPVEVYANSANCVGTLAGVVKDASVVNVSVDATNVICQGRNIVGGVVGLVCGKSNLANITSNVSVNSNFSSSKDFEKLGYSLFYSYYDEQNNYFNNSESVSYAGNVCGVVDTESNSNNNQSLRNIKVLGGARSIGTITGFVAGLVCENSGIDNAKVYVNSSNYLNSNYSAGLVCGENRGYISRVETNYDGPNQLSKTFIKNNCKFVGGIVGFNNNGTVVNSISNVNVIGNENTIVAGGVIGLSVGGACSSVIATNDVWSTKVVGGIIGMTARKEMFSTSAKKYQISNLDVELENGNLVQTIKTNNIMYIANCVAINKFTEKSLSYIIQNNSCCIGAIIGAAHNTHIAENNQLSVAVKNSYISYGNYYKNQTYKSDEKDDKGNFIVYKLQDFGVNNIDSFEISINDEAKNLEKQNQCASGLDEITSQQFNNFSKNVFDIIDFEQANATNLPKLKSVNNINTKKLLGSGTFTDPYKVDSVKAINEVSKLVKTKYSNSDMFVELTDNIEATGLEFSSIGDGFNKFGGMFNGNGYFINGLTYFNVDKYNNQNYFGLFGYLSNNAKVQNLNVGANFVINYVQPVGNSAIVTSSGIIAGYNEGYIANCNTYGGMICTLKNNTSTLSLSYIGGICGINAGQINGTSGLYNCKNNATIYISVNDFENSETSNQNQTTSFYAGFITGANLNEAIINKCENQAKKSLDLNKGAQLDGKNYTLIVINDYKNANCKNFVGTLSGFISNLDNVYGDNSESADNIYQLSYA